MVRENLIKRIKVVSTLIIIIVTYYGLMAAFFLLFLVPLIVLWLSGSRNVAFFNVSSNTTIQRTDISYFTTGDVLGGIYLLAIIGFLTFIIITL